MTSGKAARRVRRGLFRAALGVSLLAVLGGIMANLVLPGWWQLHDQTVVTIVSGSMSPLIEPGDQILIQNKTDATVLKPGDIVTIQEPDTAASHGTKLVSHRIVQIMPVEGQQGLWLQTKGDANRTNDPNLTPETAVLGVMVKHLGWLGPIMQHAQEPAWRLAAFGPALVLLAVSEIPNLLRGGRSRREEQEPSGAQPDAQTA